MPRAGPAVYSCIPAVFLHLRTNLATHQSSPYHSFEQPDQPIRHRPALFYCGTGWRASLAFFYAWLMNWERIGVYDGSWCEWSGDPANPVVCRFDARVALKVGAGTS